MHQSGNLSFMFVQTITEVANDRKPGRTRFGWLARMSMMR